VRQAHRVLSLLLASAVKDNRIARNPADGVRLPRSSQQSKRYLTHEQVAALADAAGDHGLLIRVLAYTGLRFDELAALRVSRVDLMRRRLIIAESVTEVRGKAVFGTTKNHATRSVAAPRSLVDSLAGQLAGRGPDDFVFPAPRGGVLLLRNFRRQVFDPAVRAADLGTLTPHEHRHTAASLAISAGANVKSSATHAWTQVRCHDTGRVRRPVRRRP
jgi:integrase